MSDQELPKDDWTEVPMEESRYSRGTVTPNTRIGEDNEGLFLYEEDGTTFTRTGETVKKHRSPDERPEDPIQTGFSGPDGLNIYHETDGLHRITVRRDTMDLIESHYPPIKEHLPLRLLLQYILFNRHAISLNSTWDGEGSPLKATMLARMVRSPRPVSEQQLPSRRHAVVGQRRVVRWGVLLDGLELGP